ncbi:MAG: ribosomal-processing cysteine protease Prp [Spirochaetaceae bacterium]|jgi:uncharacterized protein YsxB (DUF464 family)|nr:ribosomal-processing cysteine protease Prp [Spirochaetaceae bacterium]
MIAIDITVDEAGLLYSCTARGHALAGRVGTDIICAAVSVLLRTFLRCSALQPGLSVCADTAQAGFIGFTAAATEQGRDFLRASGGFLIEGLSSVAEEFPDNCKLTITCKRA